MTINSFEKLVAVIGFAFWMAHATGAELRYQVVDLGLVETSAGVGVPWSAEINNRGMVVGNAQIINRTSGFIYWKEQMRPLSLASGEWGTFVNGLNDRGQIVGQAIGPAGFPFLYQGGKVRDLSASLGGSLGGSGAAINNLGQAVGTMNWGRAFYFDGSRSHYIPFENASWSSASAINDSGLAVGYSTVDTPTGSLTRGFTYDGSEVKYLPSPDSSSAFFPEAVNASGQILGHTHQGVYLYNQDGFTEIGDIDRTEGGASAMNNKGWVVGMMPNRASEIFETRAFIYRNNKIHDLNDLIASGTSGDWKLQHATGINDRGQIVGIGYSEFTGEMRGFLATPVPEPADWMLLLVGLGVVGAVAVQRQSSSCRPVIAPA